MSNVDEKIIEMDRRIEQLYMSIQDKDLFYSELITNLRLLIEPIIVKYYLGTNKVDLDYSYEILTQALKLGKNSKEVDYKHICFFHDRLNAFGHNITDSEGSKALLFDYYPTLNKIRDSVKNKFQISILSKLENYYPNIENQREGFYSSISLELDKSKSHDIADGIKGRYYITKERPFFLNGKVYYEIILMPVYSSSRYDRFVAFSHSYIPDNYAISLTTYIKEVIVMGQKMLIRIISTYLIAIRVCEFDNLRKIFGPIDISVSGSAEYDLLMKYLNKYKISLLDIVEMPTHEFNNFKKEIVINRLNASHKIFDFLKNCRKIIVKNLPGHNILRLLLHKSKNQLIKDQFSIKHAPNIHLSNLRLSDKTIPFDTTPFASCPHRHIIKREDIIACIDTDGREGEFLYDFLDKNTENNGILYTNKSVLSKFNNLENLPDQFNSLLPPAHKPSREIAIEEGYGFIRGYEITATKIIEKILYLSKKPNKGYLHFAKLKILHESLTSDEKTKKYLYSIFENSSVSIISGPAGTGKTTFIGLVIKLLSNLNYILLAQTNAAVSNLKNRTSAPEKCIMTVQRFNNNYCNGSNVQLLIIDECSTISNKDMVHVLSKIDKQNCLVLLVGDEHQIQSINFGNWFTLAKQILKNKSVFELTTVHRTTNNTLLSLWKSCREANGRTLEILTTSGCSHKLSDFNFTPLNSDSIVLCLNYDGLYGINNINRLMQSKNPNKPYARGDWLYKIGDPIIFNESNKFSTYIYNNAKGKILDICDDKNRIYFKVEINCTFSKPISGIKLPFDFISSTRKGWSIIGFGVDKEIDADKDDTNEKKSVPFQVSYAVSIHKAQGLEYEKVRIIIADNIEEQISSNIFYTAITRATHSLDIYWSGKAAHSICLKLKDDFSKNNDIKVLRDRHSELFHE